MRTVLLPAQSCQFWVNSGSSFGSYQVILNHASDHFVLCFGSFWDMFRLFWVMFWFISDLARYDPEIPPSRLKSSQTSSYCICLFVSTCPSYTAITISDKRPHNGSLNQHETNNRKDDFLDNHPTSLSHCAYATCTSAISKSVTVDLRTNSAHESEISKVTYHTCLLLHRVL